MAYRQPDEETIAKVREDHKAEKEALAVLELSEVVKQNNPVLNAQREKVRKLYDTMLMYEAYKLYPSLKKDFCMFNAVPECQGEIKNTFNHWFIYGNCCAVCNAHFSKASAVLFSVKEPIASEYNDVVYTIPLEVEDDLDTELTLSTLSAFEDDDLEVL